MRGTCANYLVPDARRLLARRFPAVIITFDLTTVGSTGQYEGFSTLDGNSGATWSLVGVNDAFTQFAVNGGTIAFDSQQALGILTDLSLGGGTLSFAQDATLSGSVVTTLADDTRSTVSVASNKTLTVDGTLIGAGALSIVGGGSVVLAGSSANFVGSVRLSDATLDMGAGSGFRVATGQSLAIGGWRGDAAQAAGTLQASVVLLDGTSNWDGTRSSLVFNHTDSNYTFTSSLAGHGEVRHLSGTTTLMASAQGGFDGYTWIDGGTLKLGASQALGSDLLSVASGATFDMNGYALTIDRLRGDGYIILSGTLVIDGYSSPDFEGIISGDGNLVVANGTTLWLAGANTYSGVTTVTDSATLRLDHDGALGESRVYLALDGALDLNGYDQTIHGLMSAPTAGEGQVIIGTNVDDATMVGSLAVKRSGAETFGGSFEGAGALSFDGEGTTTLIGDSSLFSGTTRVSGGSLVVDGILGGTLSVGPGARLSGSGTVGTTLLESGSIVAPGNSPGTLTIAGDVVFQPGSTYQVEIGAGGALDHISASGAATLGGAGVQVIALDPTVSYQNGQSYVILHAAGGVTGTFAAPTGFDSAFLTPSLSYGDKQATLTLRQVNQEPQEPEQPGEPEGSTEPGAPETPVEPEAPQSPLLPSGPASPLFPREARTANQHAVATALDSLDQTAGSGALALYNTILFANGEEARQAFDSLSGEGQASVKAGLIELGTQVRSLPINRLRSAFAGPVSVSSSNGVAIDYTSGGAASPLSQIVGWGEAYGSWGRSDGNGNAARMKRDGGGVILGLDAIALDSARLGLFAGYSQATFKVEDRAYNADVDSYHLGLYAGTQFDALALRGGLSYTWHDLETQRSVFLPSSVQALSADYDAATFEAFGEVAYGVDTGYVGLEPFANLAHVSLRTDGFAETGGSAALRAGDETTQTTFTTLGLRASHDMEAGTVPVTLTGMLGWRHAFGDVDPKASLAFDTGSAFTTLGTPVAQDAAVVELGLEAVITDDLTLGLSYSGQFADGSIEQGVNARFRLQF